MGTIELQELVLREAARLLRHRRFRHHRTGRELVLRAGKRRWLTLLFHPDRVVLRELGVSDRELDYADPEFFDRVMGEAVNWREDRCRECGSSVCGRRRCLRHRPGGTNL